MNLKHYSYFQVTFVCGCTERGFIPGVSERALNVVVIDSSGLLLWFIVSGKHLKAFFPGLAVVEVTLKTLDCIVHVWQWPSLSQKGIERELRRTNCGPSSPSLKTHLNRLVGYSCRENLYAFCLHLQSVVRK